LLKSRCFWLNFSPPSLDLTRLLHAKGHSHQKIHTTTEAKRNKNTDGLDSIKAIFLTRSAFKHNREPEIHRKDNRHNTDDI
jgi:hypothetical protein